MKIKIRGFGWEEEIEAEETLDALYVEKKDLFELLKKAGKETDMFETLVDDERVEEHLDR